MILSFEIVNVSFHHNLGQFIFARLLDVELNFEVKDDATLGGIPIYNYLNMPRLFDDNNQLRFDVFVFRPLRPTQKGDFAKGQRVELVLPN